MEDSDEGPLIEHLLCLWSQAVYIHYLHPHINLVKWVQLLFLFYK